MRQRSHSEICEGSSRVRWPASTQPRMRGRSRQVTVGDWVGGTLSRCPDLAQKELLGIRAAPRGHCRSRDPGNGYAAARCYQPAPPLSRGSDSTRAPTHRIRRRDIPSWGHESRRPGSLRAARGPADRGRRAAGAEGRRGPRPGPRSDGVADRHAPAQPDPVFWRLFFGLRRPRWRSLGVELAGEVEAVGAAVTEFKVGDAVFGQPSTCFGAHAEYVCMPSERAARAQAGRA